MAQTKHQKKLNEVNPMEKIEIKKTMIYHRQKWFIDRIGKHVYRKKLKCKCESCQQTRIYIGDETQAIYMYDMQYCGQIEYFDNPVR